MNTNQNRLSRRHRTGLSVLEFLGCLFALVGGAWLGAVYLGIDVHHLAYVALSESDLLEQVPEQWRPVAPENAPGAPTSAELAAAVHQELASLHDEITALRTAHESHRAGVTKEAPVEAATPTADTEKLAKQQTLAYWNRIHEIVREQAALQTDAESATTEGNATKLAALKARINRFTASALRAIPTDDVDPAAFALSKELAKWYERSGELFDQAVNIWESPARSQSGTLTKDWEFAQLQLRNEGMLLGDKIAAVRDSLTRRFGEEFAEFRGP